MSITIRTRLVILAFVAIACVTVLSLVSWQAIQESKVFSPTYHEQVDDMDLLADVLPPPALAIEIYLNTHQYGDFDPAERPALRKAMGERRDEFEAQWKKWVDKAGSDQALIDRRSKARDLGREEIRSIFAYLDLVDQGADEAARDAMLHTIDQQFVTHRQAIIDIVDRTKQRIDERTAVLQANNAHAAQTLIVGTGLIASLMLLGCYLIGRSIIRPVTRAVTSLDSGSQQVSSAATQVSAGAQRIAQGASEQAASLEETTASLEELAATCRQNADNARQANSLAGEAVQTSEGGESVARKTASDVAVQLKDLAAAIEAIRQSTDKTTAVVESIDDIAIQINLLALNAAVEAARAGEAGMGFAVVADEVRNLAARSTEEAKNTSALIKESRANAERVHAVAKAVQDHLAQSLDRDVVGNFQQLVTKVRKMSQLIAEVAAASDEQAKGVEQINSAVAQMDKVTQENAASAEESAASSEEMQAQASGLQGTVGDLRSLVDGSAGHQPVVAPQPVLRTPPRATQPLVRPTATALSPHSNGNGKTQRPSQVLPLTDAEASQHQGDFSRF